AIDQEEQETLEQGEDLISSKETNSKPQKDTKRERKTQQVTVKHVQIAVPVPSEGWKHPAFGPTQPGLCNSGPCRLGRKQHLPAYAGFVAWSQSFCLAPPLCSVYQLLFTFDQVFIHRSQSDPHREWEEVQERVRGLLTTPKAIRRLHYGATHSEIDRVLAQRSISPGP
ncbi:hypothetical protein E3U43_007782, partial [Larimichthys crocea]